MAFSQIATSVSIISSGLKGYQAISLTNFATSAESLIASGGAVEIANAFFLADSDVTPNASSWTAVGTGNTAYIALTPAGSAGVQTVSATYTATAPEWSTSKQGWYASAASVIRYIGGVTKGSATKYDDAFMLQADQGNTRYQGDITVDDLTVRDDLTVTDDVSVGGNVGVTGVLSAGTAIESQGRMVGTWFTHQDTVTSVTLTSDVAWTTVDSVIGTNAIGLAVAHSSPAGYYQMFAFSRGGVTVAMKHGGGQDCFQINGTALEGRRAASAVAMYARYIVFDA